MEHRQNIHTNNNLLWMPQNKYAWFISCSHIYGAAHNSTIHWHCHSSALEMQSKWWTIEHSWGAVKRQVAPRNSPICWTVWPELHPRGPGCKAVKHQDLLDKILSTIPDFDKEGLIGKARDFPDSYWWRNTVGRTQEISVILLAGRVHGRMHGQQ